MFYSIEISSLLNLIIKTRSSLCMDKVVVARTEEKPLNNCNLSTLFKLFFASVCLLPWFILIHDWFLLGILLIGIWWTNVMASVVPWLNFLFVMSKIDWTWLIGIMTEILNLLHWTLFSNSNCSCFVEPRASKYIFHVTIVDDPVKF